MTQPPVPEPLLALQTSNLAFDSSMRPTRGARGLLAEAHLFQKLLRTKKGQAAMRRFMAAGGQTAEGEQRRAELCEDVASKGESQS